MNIILTETVEGLGKIGDMLKVKPGYARNFLVPQGFAVEANPRNIKELEHHKRQLERKMQKQTQDAELLKAKIEKISCTFALRAGDDGKLFGSVTNQDIALKLAEAGVEIDRKKVVMEDQIKTLGEHSVSIKLPASVVATVKVVVNAAA